MASARQRGPTMKDVAERAGVSVMTVSLALRNESESERMTLETRDRVLSAARDLGYKPNGRARALRLGKTDVIGLYAGHGYVNVRIPFFMEIVSGLQEGCEQVRRDLLLHGVFHGKSEETIYSELADGRLDGLIVQIGSQHALASLLRDSHFAVVAIADPIEGIPSVLVDDANGSELLAEHLAQLGHRKVAYLGCPQEGVSSAERRQNAFLRHADSHGVSVINTRSVGPLELLGMGVTAIACWNDDTAHRLLSTCARSGIRVPDDLAIVGFDGSPIPYQDQAMLTTVLAPWAEVARVAVHRLDQLLQGHSVPEQTVLPVQIQLGLTT